MMEVCGDGRFEIIEKAKQAIIESTNIETSPEEMAVLDNILFRCWQMGWLDKYDTQPSATGDLISRQDAIDILDDFEADIELGKRDSYKTHREKLLSIHSAYHPLCVLADRECPFQGKEYAWCLTCPHISEEDRDLVKKAVAEPKTGVWIGGDVPSECSLCGEYWDYKYVEGQEIWYTGELPNFCPNCGARMYKGGEEE